jgi:hypothetical protein
MRIRNFPLGHLNDRPVAFLTKYLMIAAEEALFLQNPYLLVRKNKIADRVMPFRMFLSPRRTCFIVKASIQTKKKTNNTNPDKIIL